MRRARGVFLAAVWGLGVLACAAQASPGPALVDPGYDPSHGPLGAGGYGVVGWEFRALVDIWVTDLGFFDTELDGLNTAHEVGIWDQGGNMLGRATVPAGSEAPAVGRYRYASLAPVFLSHGETYIIGATVPEPQGWPLPFLADGYPRSSLDIDTGSIVLAPAIGLVASDRYAPGSSDHPLLVFPGEKQRIGRGPIVDETGTVIGTFEIYPYHFAADFRFEPVPEPSTLAILAIGYLALRLRRGSKRRVLLRGFVGSSVPSAIGVFWDCASERSSP